jgi:hypothetical protein
MITGEQFVSTMAAAVKRAQDESLAAGVPITYREPGGRIVRRYPDGRLEEVEPYFKVPPLAAE